MAHRSGPARPGGHQLDNHSGGRFEVEFVQGKREPAPVGLMECLLGDDVLQFPPEGVALRRFTGFRPAWEREQGLDPDEGNNRHEGARREAVHEDLDEYEAVPLPHAAPPSRRQSDQMFRKTEAQDGLIRQPPQVLEP